MHALHKAFILKWWVKLSYVIWVCFLIVCICVFPTQRRVICIVMVKSDDRVGDWHISIERTKTIFSRTRSGIIWIHGGFEGNTDAICEKENERFIALNNKVSRYVGLNLLYLSSVYVCSPVSSCTLWFSVLIPCHKYFILMKVSSSNWNISVAAQQQPRSLKAQLQSHLSQVTGPFHWTGIGWRNGERGKEEVASSTRRAEVSVWRSTVTWVN